MRLNFYESEKFREFKHTAVSIPLSINAHLLDNLKETSFKI